MIVTSRFTIIKCKLVFSLVAFLLNCFNADGQQFNNPDLDGIIVGFASLPNNWTNVPFTDVNCDATAANFATPDLTSLTMPGNFNGVLGNPYSGNTFVSALDYGDYHEGIMQTVSGFTVNVEYAISFYQAVVKQTATLDTSGSWAVYIDTTLISVVEPTSSLEPFSSTSFTWEKRTVNFTATATTHIFKFLPTDDDANGIVSGFFLDGALRMGIDNINIVQCGEINFPNDTTLCEGDTLVLDATIPDGSYVWQDNSTDSIYTVLSPGGMFRVSATNCCGTITDSIDVTYIPNVTPSIDVGNDTTLCEGDTLVLDATIPNASYIWQDNSTDSTFVVNQSGEYVVTISNSCGSVSDSVSVAYYPLPLINLDDSMFLCTESIVLNVEIGDPSATYLWQDGSTDFIFDVTQSGTYIVEVINYCGIISDSIVVLKDSIPFIDLGNDTILCQGDSLLLNATFDNASYFWFDGTITPTFIASQDGDYRVTITNGCGVATDSLTIQFESCCNLYVPNTFTPDGNSINDVFSIVSNCIFSEYRLFIFNRWGELLFETDQIDESWDGIYENKLVSNGTYFYRLLYIDNNKSTVKTGIINVIR